MATEKRRIAKRKNDRVESFITLQEAFVETNRLLSMGAADLTGYPDRGVLPFLIGLSSGELKVLVESGASLVAVSPDRWRRGQLMAVDHQELALTLSATRNAGQLMSVLRTDWDQEKAGRLLLNRSMFQKWLHRAIVIAKSSSTEERMLRFENALVSMFGNDEINAFTGKVRAKKLLSQKLNEHVPEKTFEKAWADAVQKSGRSDLKKAGRKKRLT